ncbi:MAG: hypothetical protein LV480_08490 [Methylacidiphilales bacterium]|nr:hypothetical protein [Candidatus Methylacidiphilales bacterium]
MNPNGIESYFPSGMSDSHALKKLSCFSQLENDNFDLIINDKQIPVICEHVFPRSKNPFQNILTLNVIGQDFDLNAIETKFINFSGRYYCPRIEKIESCGPISKYKIKAIVPEKDFWV